MQSGVFEMREDIGQWLKHKSALVQEGMGDLKVLVLYFNIVI